MSDILITANNISKVYDQDILLKRGANFYALKNVDFVLKEGDFISIMGPSGSGKSTLLNCLSTLDSVSTGVVQILGKQVSQMSDTALSDYRNRYLGFIFQNHNLVPSLSIFDNIATPLILNGVTPDKIKERVNEISKRLDISHTLYKRPNECSGGERQRVAIARAMVTKPKILFCDEPTGNLDSRNSHDVLEVLRELNNQGTSIILVTHDNMIASYAKKFMYLRDGQVINKIDRNNASQVDFFNEIVKVTTKDSLLKLFNPQSEQTSSKTVKTETIDVSVNEDSTIDELKENKLVNETIKATDIPVYEQPVIDELNESADGVKVIAVDDKIKKATATRKIVYAIYEGLEYDQKSAERSRLLKFDDDIISFQISNLEEEEIAYSNIDKVKISMCSRSIISWPMPEFRFYLDLDIITKDKLVYRFELSNQFNTNNLFDVLEKHQLVIEDPYGIVELYRQKPDDLIRHRYFLYNFKKIAKKYNLDNPRNL